MGRLVDSEVEGEEEERRAQGGRGKKKKILLRRRVRTDLTTPTLLGGQDPARWWWWWWCATDSLWAFLSFTHSTELLCAILFFSLPCFYPPFSRQANVTAKAGRQAGRRRICLVLSVPVPRVKRKLSHTHTHNAPQPQPNPHNTPQSPDKRVTGHDHELRRSRGPLRWRKKDGRFTFLKMEPYMYICTFPR